MKKQFVSLAAFLIIPLALSSLCDAEKIYCKDGKVMKAQITSRTKGTIWIKREESFSVGISTKNIHKIENDDGSVSKYDYGTLEKMINKAIVKSQYAQAVRLCGIFLETVPGYARMRYLRGILNQKIDNVAEAAEDYDFLISSRAANSKIYNNRGVISAGDKEYDDAVIFFSKAINMNPNVAEAHNNLANVLMHQKKYQSAIDEYKKAIALKPNNTKALYNLGMAYDNAGDRKNAEKQWEKIIAIDPEDDAAKKALSSR